MTSKEELIQKILLSKLNSLDIPQTQSFELPSIPLIDRNQRLSLSFAQQRLWFLAQFEGASEAYHISVGFRLVGDLDTDALTRALDRIVARHEALRTSFVKIEDTPVQCIADPKRSFQLLLHDLSTSSDVEETLQQLVTEENNTPFDLEKGPLVRGRLVKCSEQEHVLLITMHHIISDGWSIGIFIRELVVLYTAFLNNEQDPLLPLAIQYPDYAVWQRNLVSGERLEAQANYWKTTLSGVPDLLVLPTDHPRPAEQKFTGDTIEVILDTELTSQLKQLSQRHGVTLFMTLLSSWGLMLSRLSGQKDVVVGTPSANRGYQEIEELIGFFVNTLAIRINQSDNPTVSELLERVKQQTLDAQANQDIPFEHIVEILQPQRSLAYSPLFQVMFLWQNTPEENLELPGLALSSLEYSNTTAQFDLSLSLSEISDSNIGGELNYASSLFERSTVERMLGYWLMILMDMVDNDNQRVGDIQILPFEEKQKLLYDWNATKTDYPKDKCIHKLFEEQVEKTPDNIAVVFEDVRLTYRELNEKANQLAHYLIENYQIQADDLVGVLMDRSEKMVIALLGVLKSGGAYVPIDPEYPEERIKYMIMDSKPKALIVDNELAFSDIITPKISISTNKSVGHSNPISRSTSNNLVYVIYTSGSTGKPKGVCLQHYNLTNFITSIAQNPGITEKDRLLAVTTICFDIAGLEIWGPLSTGAQIIIASKNDTYDGSRLTELIHQKDITIFQCTPTTWKMILETGWEGKNNLIGLCGGEAIPESFSRTLAPKLRYLWNMYGPTETTIWSTLYKIEPEQMAIRIGKPINNTQCYILNDSLKINPVNIPGELFISGDGVAKGYLGRTDLTNEKFMDNPFLPGEKMYRTGDLARWLQDGNIEHLGRTDDQVKIRGFRIELGEIEARLAENPHIREVAVIAREDASGDKRLVAYYVADEVLSVEELRNHLLASLPEYMVPAAYIKLAAMPLTSNGKLDRKALPAADENAYLTRLYEEPQGEIERTIAEIWAELLKLEKVGRYDNFFELGGHSLMVITLIERLRRADLHADVRTLFKSSNLSDLATVLTTSSVKQITVPPNQIQPYTKHITPEMLPLINLSQTDIDHIVDTVPGGISNIQDIYALTPLQEGILFHHLLVEKGDPYVLPLLLAFDSRERLDKFLDSMQTVIKRHDILRTSVVWEGLTEPSQVVWREALLPVEEVNLTPSSDKDIATQLTERFDPSKYDFVLTVAPLLRAFITYDPSRDSWLMLLLEHHLTADHTTLEIILEEILTCQKGQAEKLLKPQPFRNFVAQTRMGVTKEEHEAFFRNMLGDIDETTAPFGLTNTLGDGTNILESHLQLNDTLAQRIRECAKVIGVSPASLFHLAWAQVLSLTSGRQDVVFGTVLFGRMNGVSGSDRMLGLFINTLPIRININDDSVINSIKTVHSLLIELLAHEHASLTLAQHCSAVETGMPLFTALINYRYNFEDTQSSGEWEGIEALSVEERTNYPITLSINDLGTGFSLSAQTDSSISPDRVCSFMNHALEHLVEALEAVPDTAVRDIDILSAEERQTVLYDWNSTNTEYPKDKCIHELFEEQVEKTPDNIAVVFEDVQLTYRELNEKANQLAHYLIENYAIQPGNLVGVMMTQSHKMFIALLAVLKTGAAYIPIDPEYPVDRILYMLEDAKPVVLITEALIAENKTLDSSIPIHLIETNVSGKAVNLDYQTTSQNIAYVIYTSGSTGKPKGTLIRHQSLVNLACWHNNFFEVSEEDNATKYAGFGFDASVWEIYPYLIRGACIHVISDTIRYDVAQLNKYFEENHITISFLPTRMCELFQNINNGSLRHLLTGGEKLTHYSQQKYTITNCYGPTENTVVSTAYEVVAGVTNIPIGHPISNTSVYILDNQNRLLPFGVPGQLCVAGDNLAIGYLNRPELTAEKFVANPFNLGEKMYLTGDLARWTHYGDIEFLGRMDDQVKIRGFRIELGEIEVTLAQYPPIREVAIIAREDVLGDKRLVAYYTSEEVLSVEELRNHLSAILPEYMVPAAYIKLDAIPLTSNGKLDQKALPLPEDDAYALHAHEFLQGEHELAVSIVWEELLNIEEVGPNDNFFELGGHSLIAMQTISYLRKILKLEVSISELFKYPIMRDFAKRLQDAPVSTLPAIVRMDRNQPLRLSFGQQRLLFLTQIEGASESYHISVGVRLIGELDTDVLTRALDRIVARHEALRTTFVQIEGTTVQHINDSNQGFRLIRQDLGTSVDVEESLKQLATEENNTPFDLEKGPLVRGRLVKCSELDHVLLVTMHHIISDGWSMGVFTRELSVLYTAFLNHEPDPMPPLLIQYPDYALWQRNLESDEYLVAQAFYWKETLAGAPTLLELPTDYARPTQQDFSGEAIDVILDPELTSQLKRLSQKNGVTMFMTLLASFTMLLSRLSGQKDVVVGTPSANRGYQEIEDLIGFFVNTLAIRIDQSDNPTVAQLLERVKNQTLAATAHQDIPFEHVVEMLQPPRSLSYSPLFQVMFAWQNIPQEDLELSGLTLSPFGASNKTAKFDLAVEMGEIGDGCIGGEINYASSLFNRSTIERMLSYWKTLLMGMVADDKQHIEEIEILPATEVQTLLYDWNATKTNYPKDKCIHELFEEQVEKTPDNIAVVFEDVRLTYRELNEKANQLAHYLIENYAIQPDDLVGVMMNQSQKVFVALLGILKSGAAYIPIDPEYPIERVLYMLDDAKPVVLITEASILENKTIDVKVPVHLIESDVPIKNVNPVHKTTSQNIAYCIYTSGSTGKPKGTLIRHKSLVNLACWHNNFFEVTHNDNATKYAGFGFDASVMEIFPHLIQGACIHVISNIIRYDVVQLNKYFEENHITIAFLPTRMYELFQDTNNGSLRNLFIGGEKLTHYSPQKYILTNVYGPAENTVASTVHVVTTGATNIPIGRPIANTSVYILDKKNRLLPIGAIGELCVAGDNLAIGYLNRAELTAEKFVDNPYIPGEKMYRTGDMARWLPDGNIEFLGRTDDQVKIRGFRIELGEIEVRLAENHQIREVAVIAREDVPGDKRLVAYYTAEEVLSVEELRNHLAASLPEYMVPSAYIRLEALPLTANGKLDWRVLPEPEENAYLTHTYEPPQGKIEQTIAQIWSELLHIEKVGRYDNFFELGGHSLMAITLIERLRCSNLQADVRTIFTSSTLFDLALILTNSSKKEIIVPPNQIKLDTKCITPQMLPLINLIQEDIDYIVGTVLGGVSNIQDIYALGPMQEGIFFQRLLAEKNDPFVSRMSFAFDTRERLDSFIAAFQTVISRHDILRTSFVWKGITEPAQVVLREAVLPVAELNLIPCSDKDILTQLSERCCPRNYDFDLAIAPLYRAFITYDQTGERWLMSLLLHQLSSDHTSLDILLREIYVSQKGQDYLLPKPQPFRNFVATSRLGMKKEENEQFFRNMLGDIDETTAPFGLTNTRGDGTNIVESHIRLDNKLAERIRKCAKTLGVSHASLFHLAWARVLSLTSGRQNVVFGTLLFGRMQGVSGSDSVLGMLINILPIRIDIDEESVRSSAKNVHSNLIELMEHEDVSLTLAHRCSSVAVGIPLFTSYLNYRYSLENAQIDEELEGIEILGGEERDNYPVSMAIDDLGTGFLLSAKIDSSISPVRINHFMINVLERLVDIIETAPETPVCRIDVLPVEERQTVLYEWNATKTDYPKDKCIHELFEEQVAKTPKSIAVVYENEKLTYDELNNKANQLAHYLHSLGVEPDSLVGLCVRRGINMMIGILGILKAGGAYVPFDPDYPAERLSFMMKDCAPVALLVEPSTSTILTDFAQQITQIDLVRDKSKWNHLPNTDMEKKETHMTPSNLAYIIYTSGTTGNPKGAMIEHGGLVNQITGLKNHYKINTKDTILQFSSITFDMSVEEIFPALISGARLVIRTDDWLAGAHEFWGLCQRNGVTITNLPTLFWNQLIQDEEEAIPSTLRQVMITGDAVSNTGLMKWFKRKDRPRLFNVYGPTETTVNATIYEPHPESLSMLSIGRPVANTFIYILDENRITVPIGVAGEMYIGGVNVGRGYLNRPELTEERFLPDPFAVVEDGEPMPRMYKTGDLARWLPDGNIEYLGRMDFQVKIRGFRIELGEIEVCLASYPHILESAVIAREDVPGEKRLVAYYTADEVISVEELRKHVAESLPEYMVPAAYVKLDAMPLTSNGKLNRKALPLPEGSSYFTHTYEPPQGEFEQTVAQIWSELLSIEKVGRFDNFFELGGHSLLAVQVINRLQKIYQIDISLNKIFVKPTVSSFSEVVVNECFDKYGMSDTIQNLKSELDNLSEEELLDMIT